MISEELKKSIFISLLGHLIIFSVVSVSLCKKPLNLKYPRINFNGAVLMKSDLARASITSGFKSGPNRPARQFFNKSHTSVLDKAKIGYDFVGKNNLKPAVSWAFNKDKIILTQNAYSFQIASRPSIMFYPSLPHYFNIYFKDRQSVHIELLFKIISKGEINSIAVNRKISSGNLEADLLSIRYISRYLFLQQMRFLPDKWQTVKIDLSLKE